MSSSNSFNGSSDYVFLMLSAIGRTIHLLNYLSEKCKPFTWSVFLFSEVPYSGGNITFSLLTPEPNLRPGYNDFYNTPVLQKMVYATQVRIHLSGQYLSTETGVNHRHRYYAIKEITISGRYTCPTNLFNECKQLFLCFIF